MQHAAADELLQSCPALCDLDHSPPGSSVHGILQVRILEWVAMPSSRGSSLPRDRTCISYIPGTGGDIPSPADLPDPGIELGSPELQVVSLPTEL